MAENNTEEQVIDSGAAEQNEEQTVSEETTVNEEAANDVTEEKKPETTPEAPVKEAKKSKKKAKHDKRDDEIAELKDRITRNLAEFDNFRKRTEKEKSQMFDMGAKNMIEKLLPVIDNFERGMAVLDEESMKEPFAAGIVMVYKQLLKVLEDAGVEVIEAVGNEFNPDFHNAVMHVDDENFGENIVCEEFQKGYLYHGSVVRHSMVKVAN